MCWVPLLTAVIEAILLESGATLLNLCVEN
jgi:hypothetical protein